MQPQRWQHRLLYPSCFSKICHVRGAHIRCDCNFAVFSEQKRSDGYATGGKSWLETGNLKLSHCSFNRYNARQAGYGLRKNISFSNLYVLHPASLILQNIRHSFDCQTSLTQTLRQRERKLALSSNFLLPFTSNSYIINGWKGVRGNTVPTSYLRR